MSDSWYYLLNGQQHGPALKSEIQTAAVANPSTDILVWQEGMPDWIPFAQAQNPAQTTFTPPSSELYSPYNNQGTSPTFQYGAQKTTNGLAITSMILGIVSLLGAAFFVIPQLLAVIFGHIAIGQIKRDDSQDGSGMALAGLIMGYICLLITLIVIVFMFFVVKTASDYTEIHQDEFRNRQIEQSERIENFTIPDQE